MSNSFKLLINIFTDLNANIEVCENNLILLESKIRVVLIELVNINTFDRIEYETKSEDLPIIYVWEDELLTKTEVIKARFSSILGLNTKIPARLCYVKRVTKEVSDSFLSENHIQGYVKSKFKYGLFLKPNYRKRFLFGEEETEILLAVSTFSSARNFRNGDANIRSFELIRFASRQFLTVVGGFDKLIACFNEEQKPDHLMTYVDADWSDAKGFEKVGFSIKEKTLPFSFLINKSTLLRKKADSNFDIQNEILVTNNGNWKLDRYFSDASPK